MQKAKYHRSDAGNLIVVSAGHGTLIIKVDAPGTYITTNPDNSGLFPDAKEVDFDPSEPVDAVFKRIELLESIS